jgi:hypothetical protein
MSARPVARRIPVSLLLVLALVAIIHADYHVARPHHMRWSLAWGEHWLLALPVFALTAWLVRRWWPERVWEASAWTIGLAAFGAQIVEPLVESLVYLRRVSVPMEPERWRAFLELMTAGLLVYLVVMAWLHARERAA